MDFLTIAKLILQLLPTLIDTVKVVETLLPASSSGAQKLELVKNLLVSANTTATNAIPNFEAVWPAIKSTVDALVNTLNVTGVFKKTVVAPAVVAVHAPVAVAAPATTLAAQVAHTTAA